MYMIQVPYTSSIGSLMYAMIYKISYLAYSMCTLCRYMTNLWKAHKEALKWVMRYVRFIINHGLIYRGNDDTLKHFIKGYLDANFARCLDSNKFNL